MGGKIISNLMVIEVLVRLFAVNYEVIHTIGGICSKRDYSSDQS